MRRIATTAVMLGPLLGGCMAPPEAEDLVLDSGYRIGLASVLVREGDAARILEVVGAAANVVPEAHQYRLMFALYRAHAHELLGASQAAMAAAMARETTIGVLDPSVRASSTGGATTTASSDTDTVR